jgi:hypothetical protein
MYKGLLIIFIAILALGKARAQHYGSISQTGSYIQVTGGTADTGSLFRVTNITNAELFRVLGNGNIGIGTNNPQAKLSVNGDIFSKKIKVTQTGWPDYVFNIGYPLLPLDQVENYILLHKHLPGIMTEQEVTNDGVDLGNNQAALLKKIEELTLYLIRQNKEIQELKDLNKKLEEQNARLQKQELEIARLKEILNKH